MVSIALPHFKKPLNQKVYTFRSKWYYVFEIILFNYLEIDTVTVG